MQKYINTDRTQHHDRTWKSAEQTQLISDTKSCDFQRITYTQIHSREITG